MLEIEFEPPNLSAPCDCCGGVTTLLTRFVKRDGDATAVVYIRFVGGHPELGVKAAVSIGKWWDGTTPEDRTAFALAFRNDPESYGVMVQDAESSPWNDVELLGRMLDREDALAHPEISEVFHITDHLFEEDEALLSCFEAASAS